jgi:hypothetical protein
MPEILNDLSKQALIKAIEENMYALTPLSHNWPDAEIHTGEDVTWCITDIAFPTCNPIIHVRLKPEAVDGLLDTIIVKARKRKINLHCWVTEDTKPANLAEYLTAHNFTTMGEAVGMAIDLSDMNEADRAPAGFRIIEVKDDANLSTWCRVAGAGFGMPEQALPSVVQWLSMDFKMNQPLRLYLGLLDGKPVATSMYYLGSGVVGLYFMATLSEARNKGIGFAITQKPLLDAREIGYRSGILQASPLGLPVYLRLGFRE